MLSHQGTNALAMLVLLVVAGSTAAAIVRDKNRTQYSTAQYFYYLYGRLMTRIFWRADPPPPLPLAADQGAVVICNHRSPFDPAFIQLGCDRVVHWMVAREWCQQFGLRWFFTVPQCIPVSRGGIDTSATKLAIRYARQGDLVGMFPEGRINDTDQLLLPGRSGAALVALKARVPVLPCYVSGSPIGHSILTSLLVPTRTSLTVGQPMDLAPYYGREKDRQVLDRVTCEMLKAIAKLAGAEDYQPRIAGGRRNREIT